ncbi:MAG: response regulator [Elusimicrobia bacterium]|nr:response regulator [Elusimicrobiota bacterium]
MQEKILIIEDEPNITMLLKVNLVACGYNVDNAIDGEEGLRKINSFKPDLIIVDLRLPKISGWEICEKIKGDDTYKDIIIVIVSASDQRNTKERAKLLCIDAFLPKPIEIEILINRIEELFKNKKLKRRD